MAHGIAARPYEYDLLWYYIGHVNRGDVFLNRQGEALDDTYPNETAVANYVKSGGVYVDYCGWPMYYGPGGKGADGNRFRRFLAAVGADPNYVVAFRTWPGMGLPCDPLHAIYRFGFNRGWITTQWLPPWSVINPPRIAASYEAPSVVCPSANAPQRAYAYSAVAVVYYLGGNPRGWYFYGVGDNTVSRSLDPAVFANFIKAVVPAQVAPSPPPSQPGCSPDTCTSEPTLRRGTYNDHCVGWVQRRLTQLGYNPGPVDCDFGYQTETAVKKFQADHNLSATGVVDAATWQKLKATSVPGEPTPPQQTVTPSPPPSPPEETDYTMYLAVAGTLAAAAAGVYFLLKT